MKRRQKEDSKVDMVPLEVDNFEDVFQLEI